MRLKILLVVTAVGFLAWAGSGLAQSTVTAPFVRVVTDPDAPGGPRVAVRAPLVRVNVGGPPPVIVAPLPPPVVVYPYPAPVVAPVVPPPPPPVVVLQPAPGVRGQTLQEFAQTFRPAPGTWQATLLHPRTGVAMSVNFTLPAGTPRVIVGPRAVEFDYGRSSVVIVFPLTGGIRVRTL